MSVLLHQSDSRYCSVPFFTFKTERSKEATIKGGYYKYLGHISDECGNFTNETTLEFWKQEDRDKFSNGVVHVRTKKMVYHLQDTYSKFEPHTRDFGTSVPQKSDCILWPI